MSILADLFLSLDPDRMIGRTREVRDWIAAGRRTDASEDEVVSHIVTDAPIRQIMEGMSKEHVLAAFDLFRPSLPNYSLQIPEWVTYFVACKGDNCTIDVFLPEDGLPDRIAKYDWVIGSPIEDCEAVWCGTSDVSAFYKCEKPEDALNIVLQILCQATMVLSVPGLFDRTEVSAAPKLQKARLRRRREPLLDHVVLSISRPKNAVGGREEADAERIGRVRHQVVGHFRALSQNGDTPRLTFVRPHWRGSRDHGVRVKDYAVSTVPPFNPVSTSQ